MNYTWKILEVFAKNTVITGVKYHLIGTEGEYSVETEGTYIYPEGVVNLPFEQIKEVNLIDWIDKELVESNLQAQLEALDSDKKVEFPWLADTFTPGQ